MGPKPSSAAGYAREQTSLVRAMCLYLATKLGDLMDDLVIVGGLVPSLLVPQDQLPRGAERHVGTLDLDLGLSVLLLEQERYKAVAERLRQAGFHPDTNDKGNPSRQRWVIERATRVTVDFLISPTSSDDVGGKIRDLEQDWAAIIMPGIQLAFADRVQLTLEGTTLFGERAKRVVPVCGPGAYILLKALALRMRGENKDAYDLFYVARNYGTGVADIAACIIPLLEHEHAERALTYLREDFATSEDIGPMRAAQFIAQGNDDVVRADAVAFVRSLLAAIDKGGGA